MPHRNQHLPVVLTCSGASDVGELSDLVGRELSRTRVVQLECAASVGAAKPDSLERLRRAKTVLVIDGCASRCTRKMVEKAGIERSRHLDLGELGLSKGHSPATEVNVSRTVEAVKALLG